MIIIHWMKLRNYIDWTPFFIAWEMKGKYPTIFENDKYGSEAKKLFDDAQALLNKIVNDKLLTANAVYGIFPANAEGDDILVYEDENRKKIKSVFHTLRQQEIKTYQSCIS